MDAWINVQNDDPLGQGDILRWHSPRSRSPSESFGVIVNADCDVLYGKTAKTLTYVPILSVEEYASKVWCTERLSNLFEKHADNLRKIIHEFHLRKNPCAQLLKREDLIDICHSHDADEFVFEITDEEKERENLKKKFSQYIKISKLLASPPENIFDIYCEVFCEINGGKLEDIIKSTNRSVVSHIKNPDQHDVFFISSLPRVESGPYVAALRLFRTISTDVVCRTQADWYKSKENSFRIGRIVPELRYALVQRFSNLFVRIGIPSQYEEIRDQLLDSMHLSSERSPNA